MVLVKAEHGKDVERYLCNHAVDPIADKLVYDWDQVTCKNCLLQKGMDTKRALEQQPETHDGLSRVADSVAGGKGRTEKHAVVTVTRGKKGLQMLDKAEKLDIDKKPEEPGIKHMALSVRTEIGPGPEYYLCDQDVAAESDKMVHDWADVTCKRCLRLTRSLRRFNRAQDNRWLRAMERCWVKDTPKIHAFNYWYYRYFTDEFELYILDRYHEVMG